MILKTRRKKKQNQHPQEACVGEAGNSEVAFLSKKGVQWFEGLYSTPVMQETLGCNIVNHVSFWFVLLRGGGVWLLFSRLLHLHQLLISKAESWDQGGASGEGEVKNWELKRILSVNFR